MTEDSVSMVYESLTAGAATGLLAVPRLGETRITAGVANLQREGFVTPFADWQRTGRLSTPPSAWPKPTAWPRRCWHGSKREHEFAPAPRRFL